MDDLFSIKNEDFVILKAFLKLSISFVLVIKPSSFSLAGTLPLIIKYFRHCQILLYVDIETLFIFL